MRAIIALVVVIAGITLTPDLGAFLLGGLVFAGAGFLLLLSAGERQERAIVKRTQEQCVEDLKNYAEGFAAGLADEGEPVAA
ncbi:MULTISPECIES: hypothetical protein [Tsukamurella]|uniref:Uncharacterized protein n=2 Tax=Tsukamurella TaxID=2060 RepID=A0A5C5RYN4_9ACTN|nr:MULTISPECIES: hypothetical protein [Tsukamurella]NMD55569.1 hypothetical protein [Tsukamurella columbiensis]TWS27325.1 hypothetical protein FK530_19470 [Tsukamurella conjunctivitidis]